MLSNYRTAIEYIAAALASWGILQAYPPADLVLYEGPITTAVAVRPLYELALLPKKEIAVDKDAFSNLIGCEIKDFYYPPIEWTPEKVDKVYGSNTAEVFVALARPKIPPIAYYHSGDEAILWHEEDSLALPPDPPPYPRKVNDTTDDKQAPVFAFPVTSTFAKILLSIAYIGQVNWYPEAQLYGFDESRLLCFRYIEFGLLATIAHRHPTAFVFIIVPMLAFIFCFYRQDIDLTIERGLTAAEDIDIEANSVPFDLAATTDNIQCAEEGTRLAVIARHSGHTSDFGNNYDVEDDGLHVDHDIREFNTLDGVASTTHTDSVPDVDCDISASLYSPLQSDATSSSHEESIPATPVQSIHSFGATSTALQLEVFDGVENHSDVEEVADVKRDDATLDSTPAPVGEPTIAVALPRNFHRHYAYRDDMRLHDVVGKSYPTGEEMVNALGPLLWVAAASKSDPALFESLNSNPQTAAYIRSALGTWWSLESDADKSAGDASAPSNPEHH